MCEICGKMVSPETATVMNLQMATLKSGICNCVFHTECVRFIGETGCLSCGMAGKSEMVKLIMGCLLCKNTTGDILCRICWKSLVEHIYRNTSDDSFSNLRQILERYLPASLQEMPFTQVYIDWLVFYLPFSGGILNFMLVKHGGDIFVQSPVAFVWQMWKQQLRTQIFLHIGQWLQLYRDPLRRYIPDLALTVEKCLKVLPKDYLYLDDILSRNRAIDKNETTNFLLGSELLRRGLLPHFEQLVHRGSYENLPLQNCDQLYFTALEKGTGNVGDWLVALDSP